MSETINISLIFHYEQLCTSLFVNDSDHDFFKTGYITMSSRVLLVLYSVLNDFFRVDAYRAGSSNLWALGQKEISKKKLHILYG